MSLSKEKLLAAWSKILESFLAKPKLDILVPRTQVYTVPKFTHVRNNVWWHYDLVPWEDGFVIMRDTWVFPKGPGEWKEAEVVAVEQWLPDGEFHKLRGKNPTGEGGNYFSEGKFKGPAAFTAGP